VTTNEWVFWIGTSFVLYDTVVAWTLVLLYGTRSNWSQFDEGRAFLATKTVFMIVLTYLSVVTLNADTHQMNNYPQQGIVRIVVFLLVGIVFTWWVALVIRNQRRSNMEV
jgi:hypothetical protein